MTRDNIVVTIEPITIITKESSVISSSYNNTVKSYNRDKYININVLIGETVYEGSGKMFVNRVLGGGDGFTPPKVELTLQGTGMCKNVPVTEFWTFVATVNDDESAMAEGQGLLITKDKHNRQLVAAKASGLGKAEKDAEFNTSQFVIFYTARNPKARGALNFLDKILGMARLVTNEETMEYKVDVREWKLNKKF
jgi:hypothetical protein